ncbi:MAG: DNA damage-inducible protein DinB [Ignavibacteriae bacterium]|nr:MAG: DNA damage-inducible protein DinB [Ignavibacteriota bacterium]
MKPKPGDYDPYFEQYIKLVEGDDIIKILYEQNKTCRKLINSISDHKGNYRYADGKWTIKEVLGHILDTERIFAYRALSLARGEKKSLPGFDHNDYVKEGNFNSRELLELSFEFKLLRETNLLLYKSFSEEMLCKRGLTNEAPVTVLALFYFIAGHEKHHLNVLEEKYLNP